MVIKMRNTYLNALYAMAKEDENIISLVADNGLIVYDDFRRDFSDRYFNFGISEGNMIAAAAWQAAGRYHLPIRSVPF